ncbi:MAG: hypothetical protein M1392_03510 [Gammaproteobacteria bacterium]|nr:hypothetical protein [Gammaproteobacteria bacterium]
MPQLFPVRVLPLGGGANARVEYIWQARGVFSEEFGQLRGLLGDFHIIINLLKIDDIVAIYVKSIDFTGVDRKLSILKKLIVMHQCSEEFYIRH